MFADPCNSIRAPLCWRFFLVWFQVLLNHIIGSFLEFLDIITDTCHLRALGFLEPGTRTGSTINCKGGIRFQLIPSELVRKRKRKWVRSYIYHLDFGCQSWFGGLVLFPSSVFVLYPFLPTSTHRHKSGQVRFRNIWCHQFRSRNMPGFGEDVDGDKCVDFFPWDKPLLAHVWMFESGTPHGFRMRLWALWPSML